MPNGWYHSCRRGRVHCRGDAAGTRREQRHRPLRGVFSGYPLRERRNSQRRAPSSLPRTPAYQRCELQKHGCIVEETCARLADACNHAARVHAVVIEDVTKVMNEICHRRGLQCVLQRKARPRFPRQSQQNTTTSLCSPLRPGSLTMCSSQNAPIGCSARRPGKALLAGARGEVRRGGGSSVWEGRRCAAAVASALVFLHPGDALQRERTHRRLFYPDPRYPLGRSPPRPQGLYRGS